MNVTDYAKYRRAEGLSGCSRKAVYEARNKGWICKGPDGLIDCAKADKAWAAKSRPRSDGKSAGGPPKGDVGEGDLNLHRARKEKEQADKLELAGVPLLVSEKSPTRREYLKYCRAFVRQFDLDIAAYHEVTGIVRDGDCFVVTARDLHGRPCTWRAAQVEPAETLRMD